uniref:phycytochrome bilisome degradation protein n=1 Tax=Erythrolobus coxiae TaxID=362235 RepID=UPI001FCD776D|nr:phycytochrome bilisome degradation protein [Erythrolobus coxiae]UNJ17714.1 phycytochrome bilisome degradation protein [Erythrolobus coxiae]
MSNLNLGKIKLKQEFKLSVFYQETNYLNKSEIQLYLIELIKLLLIKDNLIKFFLKKYYS